MPHLLKKSLMENFIFLCSKNTKFWFLALKANVYVEKACLEIDFLVFFSMLDQDKISIDAVKAIPAISLDIEVLNWFLNCVYWYYSVDVIKALSNIYDGDFSVNSERLLVVKYVHKRLHHRYFKGSKVGLGYLFHVPVHYESRTVTRDGTGMDQKFIIGCRYFS